MKSFGYIVKSALFVLLLTLLFSCSENDHDDVLIGTWKLENIKAVLLSDQNNLKFQIEDETNNNIILEEDGKVKIQYFDDCIFNFNGDNDLDIANSGDYFTTMYNEVSRTLIISEITEDNYILYPYNCLCENKNIHFKIETISANKIILHLVDSEGKIQTEKIYLEYSEEIIEVTVATYFELSKI